MVVVFFAPVSANLEKKSNQIAFNVEVSKANAQTIPVTVSTATNPTQQSTVTTTDDYGCGLSPTTWFTNCVSLFLYNIIFYPLSLLTSFSAKILDFFIYYSTNSTSYSTSFIGSAWGAVRDIANIFFIIGLLYVAIETILGIGHNGKKMIASIVVVALLINFSLFFTQVIIDTSNILARVFYNNFQQVNNKGTAITDGSAQTSVSVGLVSTFNPQKILQGLDKKNNTGLYIFVTLISIAMMIFMIYIFLSIALLFVGRVAGLWVAMIFAPIAFASYTVPFDIPGLGHKKWWSDLLKQAFLAPIFIFFLYVILLLGDSLHSIGEDAINTSGDASGYLKSFMAVTIPFAIMFVLIQQAKKLAVEYSGTIGNAVSSAGATIGGFALGGAALGTAFVGRQTIGAFMKGASTGDSINQRYARGEQLNRWDTVRGAVSHYGTLGLLTQAQQRVGQRLNANQHDITHATHARHTLDTEAGTVAHGKKWNELNGEERNQVRTNLARKEAMRQQGLGNKTWAQLDNAQQQAVTTAITPALNAYNSVGDTMIRDARRKVGLAENIIQSTIGGSFDARNLSKLVASEQDKGLNKVATGLTSILANGMRSSIKSTFNTNYGTGQKDFFKDLGHTITEALKSAKVNVDLSHVGKEVKEGHGGGDHH
ncbi:MAG: hypothetical protein V4504_01490 [Patescibacteria group bacterium]